MLGLAEYVGRRQRELIDLYSGDGLRKKVNFGTRSVRVSGTQTISSAGGCIITPKWEYTGQHKLWATCHWAPKDLTKIGTEPTWLEAWKSVYGLNGTQIPLSIWKALPWSWCIDWFAGISDLLGAAQNRALYNPSRVNLMCETTGHLRWEPYTTMPTRNFGGSDFHFVWKAREQRSMGSLFTTNWRVPFLDPFRLSVLGSLAILRIRSTGRRTSLPRS